MRNGKEAESLHTKKVQQNINIVRMFVESVQTEHEKTQHNYTLHPDTLIVMSRSAFTFTFLSA